MKKFLSIFFVAALVLVVGCERATQVQTADGKSIKQLTGIMDEYCYQGVVYVQFSNGNSAWGGAKFDADGKIVKCGKPIEAPAKNTTDNPPAKNAIDNSEKKEK